MSAEDQPQEMTFQVSLHPPGLQSMLVLGGQPYLLVVLDMEGDSLDITATTGGGVPQETGAIRQILEMVQDGLDTAEEQGVEPYDTEADNG